MEHYSHSLLIKPWLQVHGQCLILSSVLETILDMSDESLTHSLDALSIGSDFRSPQSRFMGESDAFSSQLPAPLERPSAFSPFPYSSVNDSTSKNGASRFHQLFNGGPSAADESNFMHKRPYDSALANAPLVGSSSVSRSNMFGSPAMFNPSSIQRAQSPFYPGPWSISPPSAAPFPVPIERANSPGNTSNLSAMMPPNPTPLRFGTNMTAPAASPTGEADIIPTAIVIKNIPFNIKREQLLHVIRDLGIPVPYAFNYHFDQGIFRGLAFANFHSPADANEVVAALNGLDVSGRKLRVEYKKVLQAGEKERIEKEKALKRMQLPNVNDKERKRDRASPSEASTIPSLGSLSTISPVAISPGIGGTPGLSGKDGMQRITPDGGKTSPYFSRLPVGEAQETSLDLNDASTMEVYSRVLAFKDDRMRDELAFSKSLTPAERRVVHLVARSFGLNHFTVGSGDDCYVMVTKSETSSQGLNSAPMDSRDLSPLLKDRLMTTDSDLSSKKSVPDMRRDAFQPESFGAGSPSSFHGLALPSSNLLPRKSNSSLREGLSAPSDARFDSFSNFGSSPSSHNLFAYPVDTPSVPYITRPRSTDLDALEYAGLHANTLQGLHRSRSPLHRTHSPISPNVHSTPVTPLGTHAGPLDHPSTLFGILPNKLELPARPSVGPSESLLDISRVSSSPHLKPPSNEDQLNPANLTFTPSSSSQAPYSKETENVKNLVTPTITTSCSSDDN